MTSKSITRLAPVAIACFLLALALALAAGPAKAEEYRLGTMDKLRIRVVEWQTAEGAVRDWSMISGDYTVGPSGNISLPFVGEMPADGKTTSEIADAISEGLQLRFGLLDRPDAAVELTEFRPVFISGDVQTPGRYPYAPDLTVLKAVSLAGGLRRAADAGLRVERDFINARGNHGVLVAQRNGLLAKRARLIAEAAGHEEIQFPEELQDSIEGRKLVADEIAFKAARERQLSVQLKAIEDLKTLLQNEVASLEKKITSQNRQTELAREELQGIGNLADEGLVVNARVLAIERSIAELEGKVLDMQTASLRAKQDISKAAQDATNLQNDRESEIAQDRQQAEAEIEGLTLKIGMYEDLMAEATARDPHAALSTGAAAAVGYSVVRKTGDKATETPAGENTPVLPGDVIKVGIAAVPAN